MAIEFLTRASLDSAQSFLRQRPTERHHLEEEPHHLRTQIAKLDKVTQEALKSAKIKGRDTSNLFEGFSHSKYLYFKQGPQFLVKG
jgi:hypothetical protein